MLDIRSALAVIFAFALAGQAGAAPLDPSERKKVETVAERIAAAVYELDYLDPDLDPGEISKITLPILQEAQLAPAASAYLGEILQIWFATRPNITAGFASLIDVHDSAHSDVAHDSAAPEETMQVASSSSASSSAVNIGSTSSISPVRLALPPRVWRSESSDY